MALVRLCDRCRKVIKDRRFVEVGVGWHAQSFHPRCAPAVVQFLKTVHAPGIEELLAVPAKRHEKR